MNGAVPPLPWPARATVPEGTGILVVGHGTADPIGAAETRSLVEMVAGLLPGTPVELGFLEVISPGVGDALDRLRERGCRAVVAAPLLLFTAGHARRDLPEALAAAATGLGLPVRQAAALGAHPELVALSRRRRDEARAGLVPRAPEEEALLFVGRGASAPDAAAQFAAFLADTLAAAPMVRAAVAFAAAARPTLAEGIDAIAAPAPDGSRPRRVFVQPHLLFRGHVEGQVREAVADARRRHPDVEWVIVPRLGPESEVAAALLSRVAEEISPA